MVKLLIAVGALIAPIFVLAASPPHDSLFAVTPVASPAPQIVVLHADALVVDGQRIRLVDAITPQPAPHAHCVAEELASRQARKRLSELAAGVHHVAITPSGGLDPYNRINAHVLFDGADPAATLIDEGLAVAPSDHPIDWCGSAALDNAGARRIAMLSIEP